MALDIEAGSAPSPVKLAHAVFRTRDNYEAMIAWYKTVLQARVTGVSGLLTFLTYDDEHHRIAIAHTPDAAPRDGRRIGLDHLAFTYASLDDLLATYHRLKREGIESFCQVNHGPTTSIYYHDPDGNRIELQIDSYEDLNEASVFMEAQCAVNPVGIIIDPDDMAAQRSAGVEPHLLTRLVLGELTPPDPELIRQLTSD
jgi:catechol-2,3-dioxygenase